MKWRRDVTIVAILGLLIGPMFAPELLAFPYHARSHSSELWSEAPLPPEQLDKVMTRSAALVGQSPLAEAPESRRIFLTHGGWRWIWLAMRNRGSFAISRPGRETVVINRSDIAADKVWNGQALGGQRTLSGTIAHETCHGMERRHFGVGVDWSKPAWLREGYCDHVARESSLSEADVAKLRAQGKSHPALVYSDGRKRVEALLARTGGDVDALFARSGE